MKKGNRRKFQRRGSFYVYIVECCDGTYYTGYTPDLDNRLKLHNNGKGAKYTSDREEEYVDRARNPRYNSRLACQCKLEDDGDLEVIVPDQSGIIGH